eukprot:jgi/Ulvmu1/6009/UM026_0135.1
MATARFRQQGKRPRRTQRLLENGFSTPSGNEVILRLRTQQDDTRAAKQLEHDIAAHASVRAADNVVELFVSGAHAEPQHVRDQLRRYFRNSHVHGAPGHIDLRRLNLHEAGLEPARAVLGCREQRRDGMIAEVASAAVAEFFCCASYDMLQRGHGGRVGGVNCAPPGSGRPRLVNIKVSRRGPRDTRGASEVVRMPGLGVVKVSVVDLDVRERQTTVRRLGGKRVQGAPVYPARSLWECNIEMADMDFKARCIELEQRLSRRGCPSLLRLTIDLSTIKCFSVFDDAAAPQQHCIALRLRRPPTINATPAPDLEPDNPDIFDEAIAKIREAAAADDPAAFSRAVDPSTCEAFASPTAWLCLHFDQPCTFHTVKAMLGDFKVRFADLLTVTMQGSQHAMVCGGISHELPQTLAPLTEADVRAAGDSGIGICYLLDLLLVHGHLRAADVPTVLSMLRNLRAWGFLRSYREFLHSMAEEAPPFHRCNDGDLVLSRVSSIHEHAFRLRHRVTHVGRAGPQQAQHAQHGVREVVDVSEDTAEEHTSRAAACLNAAAGGYPGRLPATHPCVQAMDGVVDLMTDGPAAAAEVVDVTDEGEVEVGAGAGGVGGAAGGVVGGGPGLEEDDEPVVQASEEEEGMIYPRRVVVTPLRVLPYIPVPEVSNRVLRRYSRFQDRFLRVAFANERLGPMNHHDLSDAVCSRIRKLLLTGLWVGNRPFVFLAFSNSQLKDHGCWLYCEAQRAADGAPSADEVRQSVGELAALRVPSKFAARLGQAFSTTFKTFAFKPHEMCMLPDSVAPNGELYSDGVGVITGAGMQKVVQQLPTRMRRRLRGALPSAIQIRLGGCKGMLALWDGVEGMAPGALVGVRPSMKKFESADLAVEVCALARPMPAFVNRQLIMALLSLGIPDSVFEEKFHVHVQQLDKLVSGGDAALTVLRQMGAYAAHGVHGVGVAQGSLVACMIEARVSPRDDLFLHAMCQAYRTWGLKGVTDKSRIPLKDSINLIGVMDESGTLPAGTFWACWDHTRGRRNPGDAPAMPDSKPLPPGTCAAVSRFPLISPADVRVLCAADPATLPAALTALTNVIVFPSVGASPEPCKMSGGDLDGDIYLITWDTALVPNREAEAINYTPEKHAMAKPDEVTVEDIVDFQMDYMKNDRLGQIAIGHLGVADFATDGSGNRVYANCDKCKTLVDLHSTAVDFAKTGVPVDPKKVSQVLQGLPMPDYLRGTDRSTTVIGHITRMATERTAAMEGQLKPAGESLGRLLRHVDQDLLLPVPQGYREAAERMLHDWSFDIGQVMHRFGAEDVGEVFTGRVRRFHGLAAGREKHSEHQKQLEATLAATIEKYQREWFPAVEPAAAPVTINPETRQGLALLGPGFAANGHRSGRQQPLEHEPGTLEEMLCAASALYAAAYSSDDRVCVLEHLIRRACPWRVAPRLLLQLKLWASQQ